MVAAADPPTPAPPTSATPGWALLLPLCLTAFLASVNSLGLGPFLPDIARDLRTTVPLVGQVVTATVFVAAVGGLVIGPLADQVGYRRSLIGCMLAVALSAAGTALSPGFAPLLVTRLLGGLGGVAYGIALAVAAARLTGDIRRRGLGWVTASNAIGGVLGVPMLTTISTQFGWRGAFGAVALAALLNVLLLRYAFAPDAPRAGLSLAPLAILSAYLPLLRRRAMLALLTAAGIHAVCWTGATTYLGAFLRDEHAFSVQLVGLAYMASGVGVMLGNLTAAGRLGRFDLRLVYAPTTAAMGIGWGIYFGLPPGVVAAGSIFAMLAAIGAARGLAVVSLTTLVATETPAGPATTMVLRGAMFQFGSALGAALGGLLIAVSGYPALGLVLPLFTLLAALLVWQPFARLRRATGR